MPSRGSPPVDRRRQRCAGDAASAGRADGRSPHRPNLHPARHAEPRPRGGAHPRGTRATCPARVVLDAQAHLEGYYERFGFRAYKDPFVEDDIPHVPMARGSKLITDGNDRIVVDVLEMRYDERPVLDGVTFSVEAGEVFALLGPNGAGKTTTVEILEGYRRRTGGDVLVVGVDPGEEWPSLPRPHRHRAPVHRGRGAAHGHRSGSPAGQLPQPPDRSGRRARSGGSGRPQVDALSGVLSGGQRRRLDLALAIVGRPDVLFLDEPTTGFDPEARLAAWRLIERVSSEGVAVLLTTHDLDEAERLAHRIGILHRGTLAGGGIDRRADGQLDADPLPHHSSRPGGRRLRGARLEGDEVVIDCTDSRSDLHRFTERALDQGWALESLRVGQPRLEDLYLRIVRSDG